MPLFNPLPTLADMRRRYPGGTPPFLAPGTGSSADDQPPSGMPQGPISPASGPTSGPRQMAPIPPPDDPNDQGPPSPPILRPDNTPPPPTMQGPPPPPAVKQGPPPPPPDFSPMQPGSVPPAAAAAPTQALTKMPPTPPPSPSPDSGSDSPDLSVLSRQFANSGQQQGPPPPPDLGAMQQQFANAGQQGQGGSPSLQALQALHRPDAPTKHHWWEVPAAIALTALTKDPAATRRIIHPRYAAQMADYNSQVADLENRAKFEEADARTQGVLENNRSLAQQRADSAANRQAEIARQLARDAADAENKRTQRLQGNDATIQRYEQKQYAQRLPQTETLTAPTGVPGVAPQTFNPRVPMLPHHFEVNLEGTDGPVRLAVPDSVATAEYQRTRERDQRLSPALMDAYPALDANAFFTKAEIKTLTDNLNERGRNTRQANALDVRERLANQSEAGKNARMAERQGGGGAAGAKPSAANARLFDSIESWKGKALADAEKSARSQAAKPGADPKAIYAGLEQQKKQIQDQYEQRVRSAVQRTGGGANASQGNAPQTVKAPTGHTYTVGQMVHTPAGMMRLTGVKADGSPQLEPIQGGQ